MFSVRALNESDYDILVEWWKAWNWDAPPRDFLPENGTGGMMIEKNGVMIVAGFLYLTNSAVAWSEFIISNFEYKEKDRKDAVKILIQEISSVAKGMGKKYIYTVAKNPFMKKYYLEMGFIEGEKKVDELVMML